MNQESGMRVRWGTMLLFAAVFVAVGAGGAYLFITGAGVPRPATSPNTPPTASAPMASETRDGVTNGAGLALAPDTPLADVVVTLTPAAVARAGIEVMPARTSSIGNQVRIPGTVQPNAYRSVAVTPIVGGRVTRVGPELGDRVRRGQTLAEIYSPELAEAQTRYLSSRAELEAHEQELRRTEKLVEIGAASRQELEKIHAEHTAATTMVESLRSRLKLLGMTDAEIAKLSLASEVGATVSVPAPLDGVITARGANVGLNVDATTPLFTVVDLSTVWVVGDLYERDFGAVRVGSSAIVTTTAYPGLRVEGKVSYIDPQVKLETRTAQVRLEVPNPKGELRFGMYAEMQVGVTRARPVVVVPRTAIQIVADRSVVYLANPKEPGRFVEREVRLGEASGDEVEVLSGVQAGDVVVSRGSFSIRAERERLGLRPAVGALGVATGPSDAAERGPRSPSGVQTARVTVSDQGYEPTRVSLRVGVRARLTFLRTSDKTCGTEVTIPSLDIRRALPLNQEVNIDFTPQKPGDIGFVCGMGMLKGTIVVH